MIFLAILFILFHLFILLLIVIIILFILIFILLLFFLLLCISLVTSLFLRNGRRISQLIHKCSICFLHLRFLLDSRNDFEILIMVLGLRFRFRVLDDFDRLELLDEALELFHPGGVLLEEGGDIELLAFLSLHQFSSIPLQGRKLLRAFLKDVAKFFNHGRHGVKGFPHL